MFIGAKTIAVFLAVIALAGGQHRGGAAPEPTGASVAVVGDSYASGGWGTRATHTWPQYTALELGWRLETVRAHPGGGYVNRGGGGPYEAALTANPLPPTVDHVIVQGGFNDKAYEPAYVGAAVSRTLELVRAQAPQATITVVGTFDPGPGNFGNARGNAPAIEQAARAAGALYVDGFQFGYEVGRDGVHPTPTGHAELGHGIGAVIRYLAGQLAGPTSGALRSGAPAVIGVSRVGAFGARYFYLASTEAGRIGPVTQVAFGDAGDVPVLVQDAAGQCVPAVYRPATGTLHVAPHGGGQAEATPFGDRGDHLVQNAPFATPSQRTVMIYRPSAGSFFARVPAGGGAPNVAALSFGDRGDRGFAYSVNGSGSTLGVYRPRTSTFHVAHPDGGYGRPVTSVPFGSPGDQEVVGAWGWRNVDGSDRVGVFRPATAQWFLANTPTPLIGGPAAPITDVTSFVSSDPGDTALACTPG